MQYQKPPLTYQAQAGQLIQRGLIADAATLTDCLKSVNYYRLSGYWHPLRTRDAQGNLLDSFNPGASLAVVLDRYNFDRQLRLLLLEAIEPIEVWIRTALAYEHAHRHGPFAYTQATHLPRFQLSEHQEWLDKTRRECSQSKEDFILHFKNRYGSHHQDLPIWMAVELFSMGASRKFFAGCENSIRQNCAAQVGLSDRVLDSWLRTLTATRNFCAHHGRLWNRPLTFAPLFIMPKAVPTGITRFLFPAITSTPLSASAQTSWRKSPRVLFGASGPLQSFPHSRPPSPSPKWASRPTGNNTRSGHKHAPSSSHWSALPHEWPSVLSLNLSLSSTTLSRMTECN